MNENKKNYLGYILKSLSANKQIEIIIDNCIKPNCQEQHQKQQQTNLKPQND